MTFQRLLASSFVLVIFLMALLAVAGLTRVITTQAHLGAIVNEHNKKIELVHTMRSIIRERVIEIHKIIVEDDLFEADRDYVSFLELGNRFINARQTLESMNLSVEERRGIQRLRELAIQGTPFQEKAINLALNGKKDPARQFLLRESLPAQLNVLEQSDRMLEDYKRSAARVVDESGKAHQSTLLLMGTLAAVAILISMVIAWIVVRRVAGDRSALMKEIDERKRIENELRQARIDLEKKVDERTQDLSQIAARLKEAQRIARIGHFDWVPPHGRLYWSDEVYRIFGLPQELGSSREAFMGVVHPDDKQYVEASVNGALFNKAPFAIEHRILLPDGTMRYVRQQGEVRHDAQGMPVHMLGTIQDITDAKLVEQQLQYLAHYDALCGVPNRALMYDRLQHAMKCAKRDGKQVAVMLFDLDGFKQINDGLGHAAGDQLLVKMAQRLKNYVRDSDTIARLGGDEFALILADLEGQSGVESVAQKIVTLLAESYVLENQTVSVTASIGIALYPLDAENMDDLLKNADKAMYRAKNGGKNSFHFYAPNMDDFMKNPLCTSPV